MLISRYKLLIYTIYQIDKLGENLDLRFESPVDYDRT